MVSSVPRLSTPCGTRMVSTTGSRRVKIYRTTFAKTSRPDETTPPSHGSSYLRPRYTTPKSGPRRGVIYTVKSVNDFRDTESKE